MDWHKYRDKYSQHTNDGSELRRKFLRYMELQEMPMNEALGLQGSITSPSGGGSELEREQIPFEFTVDTTIAGVSGIGRFSLPLTVSEGLNAIVDWGDGSSDTITSHLAPEVTHTYSEAGVYTIKITGSLLGWSFNNGGDRLKMITILKWGILNISVTRAFMGCANLNSIATDAPLITSTNITSTFRFSPNFNGEIGNWDLSNYSGSLFGFFYGATSFNKNVGTWDISKVIGIQEVFRAASSFDQPGIANWNTSSVTNMIGVFLDAAIFNQDISSWDTSGVTDMNRMFLGARLFNRPINSWDVSKVLDMNQMFFGANRFNQPLNDWDVSNVLNMADMFRSNTDFNQPLDNWDVSSVTNMARMFRFAENFNQDIGSWDVSNVTSFSGFMETKTDLTFSPSNLDSIYNGWSQRTLIPNLTISFGTAKYTSAGQAGKDILINTYGWTIVDGGQVTP
jgi:surface protein